jgi:hypothetical protein
VLSISFCLRLWLILCPGPALTHGDHGRPSRAQASEGPSIPASLRAKYTIDSPVSRLHLEQNIRSIPSSRLPKRQRRERSATETRRSIGSRLVAASFAPPRVPWSCSAIEPSSRPPQAACLLRRHTPADCPLCKIGSDLTWWTSSDLWFNHSRLCKRVKQAVGENSFGLQWQPHRGAGLSTRVRVLTPYKNKAERRLPLCSHSFKAGSWQASPLSPRLCKRVSLRIPHLMSTSSSKFWSML